MASVPEWQVLTAERYLLSEDQREEKSLACRTKNWIKNNYIAG